MNQKKNTYLPLIHLSDSTVRVHGNLLRFICALGWRPCTLIQPHIYTKKLLSSYKNKERNGVRHPIFQKVYTTRYIHCCSIHVCNRTASQLYIEKYSEHFAHTGEGRIYALLLTSQCTHSNHQCFSTLTRTYDKVNGRTLAFRVWLVSVETARTAHYDHKQEVKHENDITTEANEHAGARRLGTIMCIDKTSRCFLEVYRRKKKFTIY